jgi:hypothetical protein
MHPVTITSIQLAHEMLRLSPDQFRAILSVGRPSQLLEWLEWGNNTTTFQMRVLDSTPPEILRQGLRRMEPQSQAKFLNMMEERQRSLVVLDLPEHERALALRHLDAWQEQERRAWNDGFMEVLVMTSEQLPVHYPADMKSCVGCGIDYAVWSSVLKADCGIHSLCHPCSRPDGCCPLCEDEAIEPHTDYRKLQQVE